MEHRIYTATMKPSWYPKKNGVIEYLKARKWVPEPDGSYAVWMLGVNAKEWTMRWVRVRILDRDRNKTEK